MAKLPYMQFYPSDWLLDTHILSAATRGIWIDILSLMWREEPRTGTLEYTVAGWCKRLRCSDAELRTAIVEMQAENVCKIVKDESNDSVRFTSRRIAREEKLRKANRLYVRNHRSKAVCKDVVRSVKDSSKRENQNQSHISESESEEEKKEETTLSRSSRDFMSEARLVLSFLNEKTGRNYRPVKSTLDLIAGRLRGESKETAVDVQTCKSMIAKKARDWLPKPEMSPYLRPKTLFNKTNFEQYVGELIPCVAPNATAPSPPTPLPVPAVGGHLRSL